MSFILAKSKYLPAIYHSPPIYCLQRIKRAERGNLPHLHIGEGISIGGCHHASFGGAVSNGSNSRLGSGRKKWNSTGSMRDGLQGGRNRSRSRRRRRRGRGRREESGRGRGGGAENNSVTNFPSSASRRRNGSSPPHRGV